jgi:DNA-binding transcriptional LysR family regulator
LGLGVVSLQTIQLELETRRLVVLPVDSFPIIRHWFIVHRRDKRLSAASQAFRALLLAQLPATATEPHSATVTLHPARFANAGRRPGSQARQ